MSRQDGDWYTPIIGAKIEKSRSVQKIDRGKQGRGSGGGCCYCGGVMMSVCLLYRTDRGPAVYARAWHLETDLYPGKKSPWPTNGGGGNAEVRHLTRTRKSLTVKAADRFSLWN
jgi:hypothetical protein